MASMHQKKTVLWSAIPAIPEQSGLKVKTSMSRRSVKKWHGHTVIEEKRAMRDMNHLNQQHAH